MDIGSGFNDDPLWLIAAVYAYLGETGDYRFCWTGRWTLTTTTALPRPLLEHLRRSFGYLRTHKGPHGLPLISRADWNDCLNLNCFNRGRASFRTTGPSEGPASRERVHRRYVRQVRQPVYQKFLTFPATWTSCRRAQETARDGARRPDRRLGRPAGSAAPTIPNGPCDRR